MKFRGDQRAVVIQIGAVLLLAALVIAMSGYQATVVPDQNNEIEFNHNQEVQGQLQDLRNGIVSMAGGSRGGSYSVTLGTTYPARTLFVNPGPPSGQLRTLGTGQIVIENATATASEGGSVQAYWNGTTRTVNTTAFAYRPNYNELEGAPTTVYEHSLLYNAHPTGANTTVTDQVLVDGDEITLVTLEGEIQESSSGTVSVNVRELSASSDAVSITNATDGPIRITVPTRSPEIWSRALPHNATVVSNTTAAGGDYVLSTIELDPGKYELQMARARIGDGDRESVDTTAEYLVAVDHEAPTAVVAVRDKLNNPVSGAKVFYRIDDEKWSNETDVDGRVEIDGVEPGDEMTFWINADRFSDAEDYERLNLTVTGAGGGSSAQFDVSGLQYDDPIKQGESLIVDANITNTGDSKDTQTVSLQFETRTDDADRESVALAAGESRKLRLEYSDTDSESPGTYDFTVETEDDSWTSDVTIEEVSGAYFDVVVDTINDPVTEGETLEVTADVSNIGDEPDTQTISMDFGDDGDVDSESIGLDPDETQTVTLTYTTRSGDAGDVDVTVESANDSDTNTAKVQEPAFFEVTGFDAPAEAEPGDTITVNASVTNTGDVEGSQIVEYRFDGATEESTTLTLGSGDRSGVEFEHTIPSDHEAGDYNHGIYSRNDSADGVISLEYAPTIDQFDVAVQDNSPANKKIDVDWAVSDGDSNLDTGEITLRENGESGDIVGTESLDVSGGSSDGSVTFDNLEAGEYYVEITVSDTDGNEASDSTTATVS